MIEGLFRRTQKRSDQLSNRILTRRVLLALIVIGTVIRVSTIWTHSIGIDGNRYAVMGYSFLQNHEFIMPWGPIYGGNTVPAYSHHYPPLYPLYLSLFYWLLGFSKLTTHVASVSLSLIALLVVYYTTKNLYDRERALILTSIVSMSPLLIQSTGVCYSENMVLIFYVLTVWAILRSLKQPVFMIYAGLFAGLGYLTKSSIGYFFVIAGLAGFLWRFYYMRWKVFKNVPYLVAIVIFGLFVGAWALRNIIRFGWPNWETSAHMSGVFTYMVRHPVLYLEYGPIALLYMIFVGFVLYCGAFPFYDIKKCVNMKIIRDEEISGLLLSVFLPLMITGIIDGGLWIYEGVFRPFNIRYVSFVVVPFFWFVLNPKITGKIKLLGDDIKNGSQPLRNKLTAVIVAFVLLSIPYSTVYTPLRAEVPEEFGKYVSDGDNITIIGGIDVYRFYFDFTKNGEIEVNITKIPSPDRLDSELMNRTDFIIYHDPLLLPGFVLVSKFKDRDNPIADDYYFLYGNAARVSGI